MGSSGPMSTQIYPLLRGMSKDGRSVAAPIVLWENSRGTFVGSRWMFVHLPLTTSFWTQDGAAEIVKWAQFCAQGVTELSLKTNYASYEPDERAILTLQGQILQRAGNRLTESELWAFDITVEHEDRTSGTTEKVWSHRLEMELSGEQRFERILLPVSIESGLYRIVCHAQAPDGEVRTLRQGFWGQDAALLAEGEVITRSRDYFVKTDALSLLWA